METKVKTTTTVELAGALDTLALVSRNINKIDYFSIVEGNDEQGLRTLANIETCIQKIEITLKEAKSQYSEIKDKLLESMQAMDIKKTSTPFLDMVVKSAYVRRQFDATAFKKDHPDVVEPYLKDVNCKASLEIKIK